MLRNETQTRRDLIDPVLLNLGWSNDLIKVEVTPVGTDIIDGNPGRRLGRSDYLLCLSVLNGHPTLPAPAKNVLVTVTGLFAKGVIEELEVQELFDEQEIKRNGGFEALPAAILREVFEFKS